MSTIGDKIAQASLAWLGTPHINMARVKGRGVDCGMLLIASLEDSGAVARGSIPIKPYSNEWHLHHSDEWFLHYVQTYCDKVETMVPGGLFYSISLAAASAMAESTLAMARSAMRSSTRASSCRILMRSCL